MAAENVRRKYGIFGINKKNQLNFNEKTAHIFYTGVTPKPGIERYAPGGKSGWRRGRALAGCVTDSPSMFASGERAAFCQFAPSPFSPHHAAAGSIQPSRSTRSA
jgi:hypothetical protein